MSPSQVWKIEAMSLSLKGLAFNLLIIKLHSDWVDGLSVGIIEWMENTFLVLKQVPTYF